MALILGGAGTQVGRRLRPTDLGALLCGVVCLTPLPRNAPAQAARASEYQVKAVFLFNFAQFVDWPAGAFPDSAAPLVICVLGTDPFGPFLDETIRGERVHGHALEVRRYRSVEAINGCHILFINPSGQGRLEDVLDDLKDRAILTVGDEMGFARRGGMIRFVSEHNKVRMRINLKAAANANLTINSKLLRAAEIVSTGTP